MRELMLLTVLCLLLALGSLGIFVWTLVTGNYRGLDGMLLILTSLLFAIVFFGVGLSLLHSGAAASADGTKQTSPKPPPKS